MPERLTDLYRPGDHVEILLGVATPAAHWQPGVVSAHDFPGIWVETVAGGRWFVTNRRHIRPAGADPSTAVGDEVVNGL